MGRTIPLGMLILLHAGSVYAQTPGSVSPALPAPSANGVIDPGRSFSPTSDPQSVARPESPKVVAFSPTSGPQSYGSGVPLMSAPSANGIIDPGQSLTPISGPQFTNYQSPITNHPFSPTSGPQSYGTAVPPPASAYAPPGPRAEMNLTTTLPRENLQTFDWRRVDLQWSNKHWQMMAGSTFLKDFGQRENEGREALRVIQELRLNQHGTVGSPLPIMEYWLSDGLAPQTMTTALHPVNLDAGGCGWSKCKDNGACATKLHGSSSTSVHMRTRLSRLWL